MPEYFNIGKIVATFGLQGEMVLLQKTAREDLFKKGNVLFVEETSGSFIPYFIESARNKNQEETFIRLEDVHSKEAAHKFLHKRVYLDEENFRRIISPDSVLYYLGFTILDQTAGRIGEVEEVLEMPSQLLLKVFRHNKELLIPLHGETLVSVDKEKKIIRVKLPDGLIKVYS